MIIAYVGDLGCGKTLTMTHFGKLMQQSGYTIYSNYHLEFDHNRIDNITDIESIETPKNALLLDEIWITADSRKSMQYANIILSKAILQSRKKHTEVLYTTQFMSQVDRRIRDITSLVFHPAIIISDANNIPMVVRVKILKRNLYGEMLELKHIDVIVYGTHLLYNTDELIKHAESNKYKPLVKKYKNFTGKKNLLISKLIIDDELNKADATNIATYIMA